MQREQLGAAHAEQPEVDLRASAQRALTARLGSDDLVAFGALGDRSGRELARDVANVTRALPDAAPGSQVLIVIRADRYTLAVALLAVWQRGYVAALPPEHDREAITALAAESVTVLHDTASGAALRIGSLLGTSERAADADVTEPSFGGAAGKLFQRAADGGLQSAAKDEAWLARAQALAQQLGLVAGQRCATSVGMGHPHGVLLGVLAPLLAGAAFLREPMAGAALRDALGSLGVDLLVTVPVQLTALLEGRPARGGRVGRVISVLDALTPELAAHATDALGARVEDRGDLVLRTPLLRAGEHAGRQSAEDEALLALVRAAPGVRDAAVIPLEGPDLPSRCIAVLGPALDDTEATPLALAALRLEVAARDPQAELLAVREIRRDALGRFQAAALLRLFRRRPDGSAIRASLTWGESASSRRAEVDEHRASVRLPLEYPYFEGHFPGYPILPGAAQLSELVLALVRRVRPDLGPLRGMTRLKFSGRIQPGETIDVLLQGRTGAPQLDFTLRRGQTLCAAGSLTFAAAGEPTS